MKHLTLVSPEDRARFVPVRLDFSLPPQLSPDEAQPLLYPAASKHIPIRGFWFCLYTIAAPTSTHRELHLIVLVSGHKRPPALHPLLFEDGDGGKLLLMSDHIQGTLLGRLGSAREPI